MRPNTNLLSGCAETALTDVACVDALVLTITVTSTAPGLSGLTVGSIDRVVCQDCYALVHGRELCARLQIRTHDGLWSPNLASQENPTDDVEKFARTMSVTKSTGDLGKHIVASIPSKCGHSTD